MRLVELHIFSICYFPFSIFHFPFSIFHFSCSLFFSSFGTCRILFLRGGRAWASTANYGHASFPQLHLLILQTILLLHDFFFLIGCFWRPSLDSPFFHIPYHDGKRMSIIRQNRRPSVWFLTISGIVSFSFFFLFFSSG